MNVRSVATGTLVLFLVVLTFLPTFLQAHDPPAGGFGTFSCGRAKRSEDGSISARTVGCILNPETTEGPYYWTDLLNRNNITEGMPGVPLIVELSIVDVDTCSPVQGALIDIWHCDALGIYSHYTSAGLGGAGGVTTTKDNTTFLRGVQYADAQGKATFATLFPGYYKGRVTHIHVKVHLNTSVVHTGQLYFDDNLSHAISTLSPYSQNTGNYTTLAADGIYSVTTNSNSGLFTDVQQLQPSLGNAGGLRATLTLAVNSSATGNDGVGGSLPPEGGPRPGGGGNTNTTTGGGNTSGGGHSTALIITVVSVLLLAAIVGALVWRRLSFRTGYESIP